jgi:hypothetical protein
MGGKLLEQPITAGLWMRTSTTTIDTKVYVDPPVIIRFEFQTSIIDY